MKATKSKARERLQKALNAIPHLKTLRSVSPEFARWHRNTAVAIENTFGTVRHTSDFANVTYYYPDFTSDTPDSYSEAAYCNGLDSAASVLQSMIEEIEEYWDDDGQLPQRSPELVNDAEGNRSEVFVIHGRDDGTKEAVARLVQRVGLRAVILHEQANQGSTIIEKFERHADVGFAIALLTPDDVGALADVKANLRPRARQNVILELGYFMGRLGRNRVFTLLGDGVEPPSDMAGIVYTALDVGGAWKISVVRELKAAGYDVDANLAL